MSAAATITIDQALTAAVRDVLLATPRALPAEIPIRAAMDIEPVERPYLVAITGNGESIHPKVRRCQLVLRIRSQIDAATADATAAHLITAADALLKRAAALATALAARNLRILVWTPGEFGDEQEDERGRYQDLAWTVTLAPTP